jgi:hypothetical protein
MVKIQYASRLFMNQHSILQESRALWPTKVPYLILAGNCVHPDHKTTNDVFSYVSANWKKTFLVPGILEHSSSAEKPLCWQTQAETLRKRAMNYKNIFICEHSIYREAEFTLIATPLGGAFLGARHELEALDLPLKKFYTKDKTLRTMQFINEEDQSFLCGALRAEEGSSKPIVVATYQLPVLDLVGNKTMTNVSEGKQSPTSLTGTVSFLSPGLQQVLQSPNLPLKAWIAGASDAAVNMVAETPAKTLYTTNPGTSIGYKSDWFIEIS